MIGATSIRLSTEIARQTALSRDIARGQADISTGKRLRIGSDDAAASARVADIRRTQSNQAAWATNVETGATIAARVDATLETAATALDRARERLIAARSGTQSAESRAALASELAGIADDIAALRTATDARGRDLFPAGEPLQLPIGDGVTIAATVSRDAAFGDLEAVLRAAAEAVTANDADAIGLGLDAVAARSAALSQVRGEHGVRAARLDAAREAFAASAIDLEEERGMLEGTDLAATAAALNAKLLTLDAAQAVFARLNSKTLFDLL